MADYCLFKTFFHKFALVRKGYKKQHRHTIFVQIDLRNPEATHTEMVKTSTINNNQSISICMNKEKSLTPPPNWV